MMTAAAYRREELPKLRAKLAADPDAVVWHTPSGNSHCLPVVDFHNPSLKNPLREGFRDLRDLTGYQLARLLARTPLFNTYEWQAFAIVPLESPPIRMRVQKERQATDYYRDPGTGETMAVNPFTLDVRAPVGVRVVLDCDDRGATFGELGFDRNKHAIQLYLEKVLPRNSVTGASFRGSLWEEHPDAAAEDTSAESSEEMKKFPGGHTNTEEVARSGVFGPVWQERGGSGKILCVTDKGRGDTTSAGQQQGRELLALSDGAELTLEDVSDTEGCIPGALVPTGKKVSRGDINQDPGGQQGAAEDAQQRGFEEDAAVYKTEAAELVRVLAQLRDDEDWLNLRTILPRGEELLSSVFPDGSNWVRGDARKKLDQAVSRTRDALDLFRQRCLQSEAQASPPQGNDGPPPPPGNKAEQLDETKTSFYRAWLQSQGEKLVRNAIANFSEQDEEAIRRVLRAHDDEYYAKQYGEAFLVDEIMESVRAVRLQSKAVTSLASLEQRYGAVVDEYLAKSGPGLVSSPFSLLPTPAQLLGAGGKSSSGGKTSGRASNAAEEWVRGLLSSNNRRELLRLALSRDHGSLVFAHLGVLLFIHQDGLFELEGRGARIPSHWRESIQRYGAALFASVFPEEFAHREPVTILSGLPIDLRRDDEQYVLHLFFDGFYFLSSRKEAAARVVLLADGFSGGQLQPVYPGLGSEKGFRERAEPRAAAPVVGGGEKDGDGGGGPALTKNQRKKKKKGGSSGASSSSVAGGAQASPGTATTSSAISSLVPEKDLYFAGLGQERVFFVHQLDAYRPWMVEVEQGAFFSYKIVRPHEQLEFRRQTQGPAHLRRGIATKSDAVWARELCDEIFHGRDENGKPCGHSVCSGGDFGPAVAATPAVAPTDRSLHQGRGGTGSFTTQTDVDWFLSLANDRRDLLFGGLHFGARHPFFAHASAFSSFAMEDPALIAQLQKNLLDENGFSKSNNPSEGIIPFLLPPALEEQDFALEGFFWEGMRSMIRDLEPAHIVQVGLLAVDADEGEDDAAVVRALEKEFGESGVFRDEDERERCLDFLRDPKILAEQRRRARQIRREWQAMGRGGETSRHKLFPTKKRAASNAPSAGEQELDPGECEDETLRGRLRESLSKLATQRVKFRRVMRGLNVLRKVGLLGVESSSSSDGGALSDADSTPETALRLQQHGSHLVFHRKGHASVTLVREHGRRGKARKELRGKTFLQKMEALGDVAEDRRS